MIQHLSFEYEVYTSSDQLSKEDAFLLQQARSITAQSYAPYSKFHVGAAALLTNGEIITGTNQENASYPVAICAERVLLSALSSRFPGAAVTTMAISFHNHKNNKSRHPISPCGMCRQALVEHQFHFGQTIRLILSGQEGEVYLIKDASSLLPLGFSAEDMQ
ncbi:MAG: cytidine deaminase [Chitinophagaceae bacterium]|nr:cytidine deaminase [Chitinophagaceae bacterium]MCA6475968.1 cytidine deaminase [Chitinophagaceae bacterium]MCA6489733.1 cytidine deaminase [Chitinophagaceae bacterium]MCA6492713.1 cytidine deaminase [Chitinophagaceae bacterium]MCA6511386.1 cytidine deaminase [Chitinophagaceae bacterium]